MESSYIISFNQKIMKERIRRVNGMLKDMSINRWDYTSEKLESEKIRLVELKTYYISVSHELKGCFI